MESAGFKGYFTGHSLRRTGTTRLSDAGIPKKVMKECTGHVSDAIDKYMVTSDSEREKIFDVLSADPINVLANVQKSVVDMREKIDRPIVLEPSAITFRNVTENQPTNVVNVDEAKSKCSCASEKVGSMIDKIISDVSSAGKTSIKIQIEIVKE